MPPDALKNLTQWAPTTGTGIPVVTCFIVDQSGNFILDNSKNFIYTTMALGSLPNLTSWTATSPS